jgi:hypothetical protein
MTKKPENKPELDWIDGDDEEVDGPLYNVGDTVITFNPYTEDYAVVDFDFSPLYFVVEDYAFDEEDGEYRYKLEGNSEWFAETWVMLPEYPTMTKEMGEEDEEEREAPKGNRNLQVDYWLATLHDSKMAGDAKGMDEAKKALEELTK